MRTLYLHRFRYRDRITGRWVTARYRADAGFIRTRYPDSQLLDAEVRVVGESHGYFNPLRGTQPRTDTAAAGTSAGGRKAATGHCRLRSSER